MLILKNDRKWFNKWHACYASRVTQCHKFTIVVTKTRQQLIRCIKNYFGPTYPGNASFIYPRSPVCILLVTRVTHSKTLSSFKYVRFLGTFNYNIKTLQVPIQGVFSSQNGKTPFSGLRISSNFTSYWALFPNCSICDWGLSKTDLISLITKYYCHLYQHISYIIMLYCFKSNLTKQNSCAT